MGKHMNWLQKTATTLPLSMNSECTGHHHGQTDCVIKAYLDGRLVGYLTYAEFQEETSIQHVEVAEDMQRQGIATALYEQLKQEAGGQIRHTNQTPEGAAWRGSLPE